MWDLILRIFYRFFGPESIPPHDAGYLEGDIVREIERALLEAGAWELEDEEEFHTPTAIRAHQRLNRLVDSGWLMREEVAVRKFISMHPTVMRLVDTLEQFAEEGPQIIGGRIQMVHSQLLQVGNDPKNQASGFHNAALECARLLKTLSATTFRVRDMIKAMAEAGTTREYVEKFFSNYIAELYVRDYRQLRTENHPLRYRWDILAMVAEFKHNERLYNALLEGYMEFPARIGEDPRDTLERDFSLFNRLHDVDRFLRRLDDTNNAATQRALAYLTYKLKASDRIDDVIDGTIESINHAESLGIAIEGTVIPQGPIVGDDRLRMASPPSEKPVRQPLKRREMTVQEKAEFLLRRAMASHRDSSFSALQRYVQKHLPEGKAIDAEKLPVDSVENVVMYLAFAQLSLMTAAQTNALAVHPLFNRLGVDVKRQSDERTINHLWDSPKFTITRRL